MNTECTPPRKVILPFIIFLFCLYSGSITAQEFVFDIVFTDAMGNTDSVEVGYDQNATNSIDSELGEVNIISNPWDSIFDVRISKKALNNGESEEYHLKRQIIKKDCDLVYPFPIEVSIKAKHWPVTASWNPDLFENSCNEGSLFTSTPPGGWWDVGSPSDLGRVILKSDTDVTFTDNIEYSGNGKLNVNYAYEDSIGGIISIFWMGLGKDGLGVSTKEIDTRSTINIYPNPAHDIVIIEGLVQEEIDRIELYTLTGEKVMEVDRIEFSTQSLDLGCYLISIVKKDKVKVVKKLFKL